MDLLVYLENFGLKPKKVSSSKGGEYASACPLCGGTDRFHFWPHQESSSLGLRGAFWCRGCELAGNLITLLMEVERLSYPEACKRLGVELKKQASRPVSLEGKEAVRLKDNFQGRVFDLPPAIWQERCEKIVRVAHECLLKTPSALAWLANRGIDKNLIIRFSLGWLPGEAGKAHPGYSSWYTRPRKAWGLPEVDKPTFSFPRGLVIPRIYQGKVVSLRIRRQDCDRKNFAPETKYCVFPGSSSVPLFYMPTSPTPKGYGVVTVESELDGILLAGVIEKRGLPVGVLATLSDRGKPHPEAHNALLKAACILVAQDFDLPDKKGRRAGAAASQWWLEIYPRAKRWPVPEGKDPGEAFEKKVDLAHWLSLGLPPVLQVSGPCLNIQGKTTGQISSGEGGARF